MSTVGVESGYPSTRITDSRRLFGPNLFSVRAGAVLEVSLDAALGVSRTRDANGDAEGEVHDPTVVAWADRAAHLCDGMGWATHIEVRMASQEASLFCAAPIDGLMTATELAEQAWVLAEAEVDEASVRDDLRAMRVLSGLRAQYARERALMPDFVPTQLAAASVGRNVTFNDEGLFVGSGAGTQYAVRHATASQSIAVRDVAGVSIVAEDSDTKAGLTAALQTSRITSPRDVKELHKAAQDCPIFLVTGSNGKTTTARLVAAMWRAHGRRPGLSCSDGVWIDGAQVEDGDFSGPGGAHRVLADTAVEAAILESARGGMLRRGLAASVCDGAVITNIAADHFGEYGVESLDQLADVKAIVSRALRPGALLVLNADDESLVALSQRLECPVAWFSRRDGMLVHRAAAHGVWAATVREGVMQLCDGAEWHVVGPVADMPITHGGTLSYNVENALAAALLAFAGTVPLGEIQSTLRSFGALPSDNPGRYQLRLIGGVSILMDYAHNPAGLAALCASASALPAQRRLLLLGQAGDRRDAQLEELAAAAWQSMALDRVIVKEMEEMRRGRPVGNTSAVLRRALKEAGAPPDVIGEAVSEIDGVRQALAWAQAGDLLVLGVHAERDGVYALMDALVATGWKAGDPLPD